MGGEPEEDGFLGAVPGSIVMGLGIAAMHYVGMEAMRLAGMCQYNVPMVALSVALAIVISFVAMYLVFQGGSDDRSAGAKNNQRAGDGRGDSGDALHGNGGGFFYGFECGAGPFACGEYFGPGHGGNHDGDADGAGDRGAEFGVRSKVHGAGDGTGIAEKRYRSLFERSLAGVIRTTLDGRILECNDACARIFGFASREELMATQ